MRDNAVGGAHYSLGAEIAAEAERGVLRASAESRDKVEIRGMVHQSVEL